MKRIIDKNSGLFIRDDYTFNEETEIGLDLSDEQVAQFSTQPFFKRRWNFETEQWEESASQEYIDSLKQPIVREPNLEERITNVEQEQEVIITVLSNIMGV